MLCSAVLAALSLLCLFPLATGEKNDKTLYGIIAMQSSTAVNMQAAVVDSLHLIGPDYSQSAFAIPTADNAKFKFNHPIPPGIYALQVKSITHQFPTYRVQVKSDGKLSVSYIYPGLEFDSPPPQLDLPLKISPVTARDYFTARESFNLLGMLMSPMVLMMIVPLILVFVLPKMIDPETMKEFREQQAEAQRQAGSGGGQLDFASRLQAMLQPPPATASNSGQ